MASITQALTKSFQRAKKTGVAYAKKKAGEEYHLSIFSIAMFAAVLSDLTDFLPAIGVALALFMKPLIAFLIWKHGDFKTRLWRIILFLIDIITGVFPITSFTVAYVWYSAAKKARTERQKQQQALAASYD